MTSIDDPFDDIFELYIVFDQYTTAFRKIGFEFEQIFDEMFSFFVSSQ